MTKQISELTDTELSELVAVEVMQWQQFPYMMQSGIVFCPPGKNHISTIAPVPDYASDIAAAFQIHESQRNQLFSKRRAYLVALGELLQNRTGDDGKPYRVAYPDAMMFLSPRLICEAALQAKRKEQP